MHQPLGNETSSITAASTVDNSPAAALVGNANTANLAACPKGTNIFTHTIIDEANISSLDPMGIMTAQHIIPTQADHFYIYSVPNKTSPIYAPADLTVLAVVKSDILEGAGLGKPGPKNLFFAPCRSVAASIQLSTFSDKINQVLNSTPPTSDQKASIVENKTWDKLSIKFKAGELLGTIGDPGFSNSLDFATVDTRIKPLAFINKSHATGSLGSSYFYTVCGLDYFTGPVKTMLYSHLVHKNAGANGIPACGTSMQDKAGTVQGNWYNQNSQSGDYTSSLLAFAHHHEDPTQAVFSVGTDLIPNPNLGTQIQYTPQHSGYINREPGEIKADGHVYCVQGNTRGGIAHVDFQLTNQSTLKIDYTSGSCSTSPALSSKALTYTR